MSVNTTRPSSNDRATERLSGEIKAVVDCSMAAWNAGDLEGFLGCYENSPHTSYLTSDQIVVGYAEIEKLYAERFATVSAARRGMLSMSLSRVVPLGAEHSLAIGRYLLSRDESNGGPGDGVFSSVLRRTPAGWGHAPGHTAG